MDDERKVIIVAGPNGAGKTTFAKEFLSNEADCPIFVNADLIAAGLAPFAPASAAMRAGRVMLDELERHFAAGDYFLRSKPRCPVWAIVATSSVGRRKAIG